MSRILSSVLDKVSENNNEYRRELRTLNNLIDEKTTALVGEIVTISNYTADFSHTITFAKENLVGPISRTIESYAIRDLRSVEAVNEQFVEKINDKLENANISTNDEKTKFMENLNHLLNDKYLEIVKIKRVDFFDENYENREITSLIEDFKNHIKLSGKFNESELNGILESYKKDVYGLITNSLAKISDLYLNNFVNEIESALNSAVDFDGEDSNLEMEEPFKPYIPDINPVSQVDIPFSVEVPPVPEMPKVKEVPAIPDISAIPEVPEIPAIPEIPKYDSPVKDEVNNSFAMNVEPVIPIEIKEDVKKDKEEPPKKTYDVEEILKIAKSPVVTMPSVQKENKEENFVNLSPLKKEEETTINDSEFNEKELVEEMIRRLSNRLQAIDERQAKYDEEKKHLEEDEKFVNDLINSSNEKKQSLDKFEKELDDKEKELELKKQELDKKINNVLPFAKAVLDTEKES